MSSTPNVIVTEPQRRLERALRDLAARITGLCRRVAAQHRRAARAGEKLELLNQQHPDFKTADLREALRHWKLLLAVTAAFALDAVMAGPVGEHLLRTFLLVSPEVARVARFGLPAALLTAEMGIAQLRVSA